MNKYFHIWKDAQEASNISFFSHMILVLKIVFQILVLPKNEKNLDIKMNQIECVGEEVQNEIRITVTFSYQKGNQFSFFFCQCSHLSFYRLKGTFILFFPNQL